MSIDEFADFVETTALQQREEDHDAMIDHSIVRLVPISAVGFDFIQDWDLRDGQPVMNIKPGAKAIPWNIELPIACVLPDIVAALQAKARREQAREQQVEYSSKLSWWERIQIIAPKIVRRIIPQKWSSNVRLLNTIDFILERNAQAIEESEEARKASFEEKKSTILADLNDEIGAFQVTLLAFSELKQKLNTQFPESELS